MSAVAGVAAVSAALYAAHMVADHWVQTSHQAANKGGAGWRGRIACAAHVGTYTATAVLALLALVWRTGLDLDLWPTVVGLLVSAVSHYIADRRTPLRKLAEFIGAGGFWNLGAPRPGFADNPSLGTGAYALDQSWHVGWLFISALIIGGGA